MADLVGGNSDLFPQILILLPIKPLIRCTLVSKLWRSTISSAHFRNKWSRFHLGVPSGIFLRSNPNASDFHYVDLRFLSHEHEGSRNPFFESLHFPERLVVHQSSFGLLLCRTEGPQNERTRFSVLNPVTKEHRKIPDGGKIHNDDGFMFVFDPVRSTEYQVVWLRYEELEIWNYSSGTDNWIKTDVKNFEVPLGFLHGTYYDEAIYWIGSESFSYLDMSTHKYQPLQLPFDPYIHPQTIEYFGLFSSRLECITVDREKRVMYIYKMISKECLFEKFRVDISAFYPRLVRSELDPPPRYLKFTIIACQSEGPDLYVVFHAYGRCMRLHTNNGIVQNLYFAINDVHPLPTKLFDKYGNGVITVEAFFYYESLIIIHCREDLLDLAHCSSTNL